jgi:hypothetical protein
MGANNHGSCYMQLLQNRSHIQPTWHKKSLKIKDYKAKYMHNTQKVTCVYSNC